MQYSMGARNIDNPAQRHEDLEIDLMEFRTERYGSNKRETKADSIYYDDMDDKILDEMTDCWYQMTEEEHQSANERAEKQAKILMKMMKDRE